MKGAFFYSLLILIATESTGQFSIEHYLAASVGDAELEEVRRQREYYDMHSFASPWLREVEFRTSYSDPDIGLQDYRVRVGLLNPFEIAANKSYKEALGEKLRIEGEVKLNEVLESRYLLLIEHLYLSRRMELLEAEMSYIEKLKSIIGDLKLSDQQQEWISLEEDGLELELKREEIRGELRVVNFLISERVPLAGTIDWNSINLISLDQLSAALQDLNRDSSIAYLPEVANEYLLAQKEYKIDKAQSRSNIGFIQAEYENDPDEIFRDQLGFQIGVAIPIVNKDKPELQRKELELIGEEEEYEESKRSMAREHQVDKIETEYLLNQARIVERRIERFEELNKPDPLAEFDLGQFKRAFKYRHLLKEKRLEFYAELLELYIRQLHDQGLLIKTPFVNYLSPDLEEFEMDNGY